MGSRGLLEQRSRPKSQEQGKQARPALYFYSFVLEILLMRLTVWKSGLPLAGWRESTFLSTQSARPFLAKGELNLGAYNPKTLTSWAIHPPWGVPGLSALCRLFHCPW